MAGALVPAAGGGNVAITSRAVYHMAANSENYILTGLAGVRRYLLRRCVPIGEAVPAWVQMWAWLPAIRGGWVYDVPRLGTPLGLTSVQGAAWRPGFEVLAGDDPWRHLAEDLARAEALGSDVWVVARLGVCLGAVALERSRTGLDVRAIWKDG